MHHTDLKSSAQVIFGAIFVVISLTIFVAAKLYQVLRLFETSTDKSCLNHTKIATNALLQFGVAARE